MQSSFLRDDMAEDQQARANIVELKKLVEDTNDRTLRLGDRLQELKDFIQTDVCPKVAKIEGRTDSLFWVVGIALTAYLGLFIAGGTQLYFLNGRLSAVESTVTNISKGVDELRIKTSASSPTEPESIRVVEQVLQQAKSGNVKLSRELITNTGEKFLQVAETAPNTWQAMKAILDYKSFIDSDGEPTGQAFILAPKVATLYHVPPSAGPMNALGRSIPPDTPQIHPLGETDLNQEITVGPAFVRIRGGTITLDGFYFKRVIIVNAHIVYAGGPVILNNVFFVNCTFDIPREMKGIEFAKAMLSASRGLSIQLS